MDKIFGKATLLLSLLLSSLTTQAQNDYVQCEDTCNHVHGIDLSHYQGNVFWETIGDNTKMAYVYLKATEGGDRIDDKYENNIQLAHKYGLKVGSYHSSAQRPTFRNNSTTSCSSAGPRNKTSSP